MLADKMTAVVAEAFDFGREMAEAGAAVDLDAEAHKKDWVAGDTGVIVVDVTVRVRFVPAALAENVK